MFYDDELDQSMTTMDGTLPVGYTILGYNTNLSLAQSFIPQKEFLTRLQFLMAVNTSTTQPCVLAIRDNRTEENLVVISLQPDDVPVVNESPTEEQFEGINFNFTDIWVTPGQVYYIVLYSKAIPWHFYWIAGNGTNMYLNGTTFISVDNGNTWGEFPNADGCFKTDGLRKTFLDASIKGRILTTSLTITNIGNYTAWDVVVNITVTGGQLGRINGKFGGGAENLPSGSDPNYRFGFFLGLGPFTKTMKIYAANVKEITIEKAGTIFLFYILL